MADGDEAAMTRYADVYARFEAVGGYGWRDRANTYLHGLGFADEALDRELSTFSGGQLTRASLARALAVEADLLLLDEPTNHLDIESLEWLEQTLTSLDCAIVLVAHDRWFLEAVGTARARARGRALALLQGHVAQLAPRAGRARAGARQGDREAAGRDRAHGAASSSASATKASKAKQAQSRVKALDKIEQHHARSADTASLGFQFAKPERTGPRHLRARGRAAGGRRGRRPQGAARGRRDVARARRARVARRAQRHRQDHADRRAGRARARSTAASCAPATTSRSAT